MGGVVYLGHSGGCGGGHIAGDIRRGVRGGCVVHFNLSVALAVVVVVVVADVERIQQQFLRGRASGGCGIVLHGVFLESKHLGTAVARLWKHYGAHLGSFLWKHTNQCLLILNLECIMYNMLRKWLPQFQKNNKLPHSQKGAKHVES